MFLRIFEQLSLLEESDILFSFLSWWSDLLVSLYLILRTCVISKTRYSEQIKGETQSVQETVP